MLPGLKDVVPVIFCSIFPESEDVDKLKQALEKLNLNDSSFSFEMYNSNALGLGFRCGFLGLLHLEIILQRLEREYNANVIPTTSSVEYKIIKDCNVTVINNPSELPEIYDAIEEPIVLSTIILHSTYLGHVLELCRSKRAIQRKLEYIGNNKVLLEYEIPLNEIVIDFYDKLKSVTSGYASFEYEQYKYVKSDIVPVSILVNSEAVDPLTMMVHRSNAEKFGRAICEKLTTLIPRQQFPIIIQAAIRGKIIARETIKAYRKDVTAKLYGGDVTRKKKLLEKQKAGKKRRQVYGRVELDKSVFINILKI